MDNSLIMAITINGNVADCSLKALYEGSTITINGDAKKCTQNTNYGGKIMINNK